VCQIPDPESPPSKNRAGLATWEGNGIDSDVINFGIQGQDIIKQFFQEWALFC
jgi:hypothetical protein